MKKHEMGWIFLLGILIQFVRGNESECHTTNKCTCYHSNEYEFQCPPGNFKIVLQTIPQQFARIDCYDLPEYDLSIFPDVNVGNLDYFEMRFCPLPHSFSATLEKFNITSIKSMELEELSATTVKTITKDLFNGLTKLERLTFSLFKIKLEADFLENLPNLVQLYLDNNEIQQIESNMFYYTPKLRVLHLSRNQISLVPDGAFKNLSTLQQLHLWKNELTSLNKHSFTGLHKLKSLELSSNKIVSLDEDTFAELIELVNISLRSNNINVVMPNIFRYNPALEGVRIGNNPRLNLSDYVFANLTKLINVNIDSSNLKILPQHLFEGSFNILDISLKNNSIKELPEDIFKDMSKLKRLNLEGNKIETLPDTIFSSLKHLEELNLGSNDLTGISESLFKNTPSLKILNLRDNKIATVHLNAFIELRSMTKLDLSYNKFDLKYGTVATEGLNPFTYCEELRLLNLSHNIIDHFPENIVDNKVKLIFLDLGYNDIRSLRVASLIKVSSYEVKVYLNNNNISSLEFREILAYPRLNPEKNFDASHYNDSSTLLYLSNNPITCDCDNFDLIQYNNDKLDPVVKTLVDIRFNDLYCSTPKGFAHILVKDLKPSHITCPLEECPKECVCDYRSYDNCAVMNCSYRNLTNAPTIHVRDNRVKQVEVNLEGNVLKATPYEGLGYENVTRLFLSNNQINNLSWIPPKIKILKLDGNKLTSIDSKVLHNLNQSTTLQNLTLYGNPWTCSCSSVGLQNYLRIHFKKVNPNDVKCEDNKLLIDRKELCKSHLTIVMAVAIPILLILLATATTIALYFYYQQEIKVWLYAKNLCLWFVTEDEIDKDKTYDIFISYSNKDEEFVIQNLLPVLESGPNPFKICIHVRDWVPGEFIATQVTNSVLDSKRTLVILSDNFLESVWGKLEFRTAHTQAISEGRARVVVVKYGSLNEEKLDSELKTYLKTNTYVEWGDPWFWNKLKYALPHSKKPKYYTNNQKHANIMLKIDDKFELVTSSPTAHVESTPPVISLDPSLLKDHPLNFKSTDNITTPPAEAPLMINR